MTLLQAPATSEKGDLGIVTFPEHARFLVFA